MRLQKRLSRKIGKKEYVKWVITIPPKNIETLGWKEKQSLVSKVGTDKLIIEKGSELSYEQFKTLISDLLKTRETGFTWKEIKERLRLQQTVPNNKWVHKLETDIGLTRETVDNRIIWKLRG